MAIISSRIDGDTQKVRFSHVDEDGREHVRILRLPLDVKLSDIDAERQMKLDAAITTQKARVMKAALLVSAEQKIDAYVAEQDLKSLGLNDAEIAAMDEGATKEPILAEGGK